MTAPAIDSRTVQHIKVHRAGSLVAFSASSWEAVHALERAFDGTWRPDEHGTPFYVVPRLTLGAPVVWEGDSE